MAHGVNTKIRKCKFLKAVSLVKHGGKYQLKEKSIAVYREYRRNVVSSTDVSLFQKYGGGGDRRLFCFGFYRREIQE